jgi:hypothetical protein
MERDKRTMTEKRAQKLMNDRIDERNNLLISSIKKKGYVQNTQDTRQKNR